MEQYRAVSKMITTIKLEEDIPLRFLPAIRAYLQQMYAVGYDQGRHDILSMRQKQVIQMNQWGIVLNTWPSVAQASRETGFNQKSIYSAIRKGSLTKQKHIWTYVEVIKEGSNTYSLP